MEFRQDADSTKLFQSAQIAADRAFGYLQYVAEFSLRDDNISVLVGEIVKDKVNKLACGSGFYAPAYSVWY